ncbi:MAG: TetR/AcrR family transcriptional regulator, partial [Vulcanimicrobiaceae bacterium]
MPRDVVKTIRGRAYRYRVESYRDPATGKTRGRWTYLGKVAADDGAGTVAGTRRDAGKTRAALLDATERLLGVIDLGKLTAAGIATEAGLGHGTFYRHFRNKGEAVRTAIERYRAGVDRERPSFEEPLGLRPT